MIKRNERSLNDLWGNMKHNNVCIIGVSEGEESEQRIENLFEEIMAGNFPNLEKEKVTQVQEEQRVPIKMNPKRPTKRHIIIKMVKAKDKKSSFNLIFIVFFPLPFGPLIPPSPAITTLLTIFMSPFSFWLNTSTP